MLKNNVCARLQDLSGFRLSTKPLVDALSGKTISLITNKLRSEKAKNWEKTAHKRNFSADH
jgi:hypothetical protein